MPAFSHITEPVTVADLVAPNRVMLPAMDFHVASSPRALELLETFYSKVAAGGTGIVVIGGAYVHVSGRAGTGMLSASSDGDIPALARLAASARGGGGLVGLQLFHAGRYTSSRYTGGRRPVAPSPLRPPILSRETPRELAPDEIMELVEAYASACLRALRAGYDFVEINSAMGYLPALFLSKRTNLRRDEYGGSLENRARFLLEVVRGCRRRGARVAVRLSTDDFMGGWSLEEAVELSRWLEAEGVALISVVPGWHESPVPLIQREVPPAGYADHARKVRDAVNVPVAYTTRVTDLRVAERLVAEGYADVVGLGRPHLAEPELYRKTLAGEPVRPCVACSLCLSLVLSDRGLSCSVNPGLYSRGGVRGGRRVRALVVGSGASGMEAAALLAEMGHEVYLASADERLGGALLLASKLPHGADFGRLVEYYSARLRRLGVELLLGRPFSEALYRKVSPDLVVWAAGMEQEVPSGALSLREAFELEEPPGTAIVLGSGMLGLYAADYLASIGTKRVYVVGREAPGEGIGKASRWVLVRRLRKSGVEILAPASSYEVSAEGGSVRALVEGREVVLEADAVVAATGFRPVRPPRWLGPGTVVRVGTALTGRPGLHLAVHTAWARVRSLASAERGPGR